MAKFILRFSKKVSVDDWNTIEKALSHKYLKKIATGNPKRPWYYIYNETFLKPFTALKDLFGLSEKRISTDYEQNNIKKDYGVDKKTFAAHVLEFFTNKDKWNTLFKNKADRDKNKKPVTQKKVEQAFKERASKNGEKVKEPKRIINRSLMRKVWEIYSPEAKQILQAEKDAKAIEKVESETEKHENRSRAMFGNDNAKKDGILSENNNGGKENGKDNTDIEQSGLPESFGDLRTGRSEGAGNQNVLGAESGDNGIEPLQLPDQLGGRPRGTDGVNVGRGRITKAQARKIREQCRDILNSKTDSEITEADKAILRQYVGAGGTDEEGTSNSGVLYEFYTPRNVINKVWELVDKYNPRQDKTVIEPSSGIGRFAEGRSEKFTMFELEDESSRIARILHPNAEIVQGAFQENFMKNKNGRFTKDFEKFDVAVGNPPYGKYTGKYKGMGEGKEFKRYEGYFISKTLDTLKDGGIMAMVVPQGFMDCNSSFKSDVEKIAKKAEILESWRLPNGTFESTDVGTDIIVLRKGKGTDIKNFSEYFEKNPDHIAGEVATRIGRFGEETYIKPKDGETFESAVANISVEKTEIDAQIKEAAETVATKEEKPTAKEVTSKTVFGDVVKTEKGIGRVSGYIKKNRKTAGVVVNVNGETVEVLFTDEQTASRNRSEAMKGNQNAKGEHDYPINPEAHILDTEEFNKKYGKNIKREDLPIWRVTDKYGNVDMSRLNDSQKEYVEKNYVKDGGVYTNPVNYASGNIREKLNNLDKDDPQYEMKKKLLEDVCPKEKKLGQITLSPITDWAREYTTKDGMSLINGFYEWARQDGTIAPEEIPPILNFRDIRDFIEKVSLKLERGESGTDDKKGHNRYRAQKLQLRRETAIKLFNRYLREGLSPEDQKDLVDAWNLKSNSFVNPDFTKIPIFVDGMSSHKGKKEFNLLDQQIKGISMLTNKGTGLLAYDVGVGKTACGIVATVNQIQTGRSKRPLIAVPKAVYTNWIKSIHQLFPNVKVNELGNLSKDFWKQGESKIEDGTISVCTYEGLENIGFNEEEEREIHEDVEFSSFVESGDSGKKSKRAKASADEKNDELVGAMAKTRDMGVQFSELGFDHITVDEVHNFRNLFKMPRHMNKKGNDETQGESNEFQGLGSGGKPSNRAMKLFAITQLIQRHNDGRNTFLLSATPFQNSPTEIYSILSYMARDKLKEMGYYSLEQFVSNFCKIKTEYVVKANRVTEAPVVKGFENIGELQNLLTSYMDKVDGEEAGVVRPYKRMHAPELELSDLQKAIMDECSEYIETQEQLPKDDRDDGYMFRAMNAMKNCALSPALVSPEFIPSGYDMPKASEFVESSPKLKFVCDSIIKQYKQNPHNGQIMYMPSGVEQFPQVKDYLVKHGMPKEAIGLVSGGSTSEKELDKRDELFKDFNNVDGQCKVIIGSSTIKEGCNLQGNTTTIYNTQLDWNPTDVQQLWGRGWRQGNKQGIVHCVTPLMHDSLDPMIYQKHDEKSSRTDDLYSYKGDAMNAQDVNPEELKFSLIKDPRKRADLQVMEYREKNLNDQKMYAQLIDVLHNQEKIAFKADEDLKKEADNKMPGWSSLEKEQKELEENTDLKDGFKSALDAFKKKFKGKEDSFKNTIVPQELIEKLERNVMRWGSSRDDNFFTTGYGSNKRQLDGKEAYNHLIEKLEEEIESCQKKIADSKHYVSEFNKVYKKLDGQRASCKKYLESKGIKSPEDCESKIQDYVKLMDEARSNVEKAKEKRDEFYEQAVEYNEKNKKNLLSVDELVNQNVDSIMNDLHLMDDDFKAKIKAENDMRFGRTEKAVFFAADGYGNTRLYIKKSYLRMADDRL